jgi:hypothetical protein
MLGRRRGREREHDRLPPSVHQRPGPLANSPLQGALALNGATFINPVLMNMGPLLFDWLYPLGLQSGACSRNSGRLDDGQPPSIPVYVVLLLLNQQLRSRTTADAQASAVSHVVAIYQASDGRGSKEANLTEAKEAAPPNMEACVALAVKVVSEDDSSQAQLGGTTGCARSWHWKGVPGERAPEREHTGGAAATEPREANDSTDRAPAARALAPLPLETWGVSAQWKQESRTRYIKLRVPSRAYQYPSLHNFIMAW